jgi:hypothetical protein
MVELSVENTVERRLMVIKAKVMAIEYGGEKRYGRKN